MLSQILSPRTPLIATQSHQSHYTLLTLSNAKSDLVIPHPSYFHPVTPVTTNRSKILLENINKMFGG